MSGPFRSRFPPPPPPRVGIPPPPPSRAGVPPPPAGSNPLLQRIQAAQATAAAQRPSLAPQGTLVPQRPSLAPQGTLASQRPSLAPQRTQPPLRPSLVPQRTQAPPRSSSKNNADLELALRLSLEEHRLSKLGHNRTINGLDERGLHMIEVNPNGNCLFLSLSFLLTNTYIDIATMKNNFLAMYLRKKAIEGVINSNTSNIDLIQVIQAEDVFMNRTHQNFNKFDNLSRNEKSSLYKSEMTKFTTWAGNYELTILHYLIGICIEIFKVKRSNNTIYSTTIPDKCKGRTIKLFHTGNHYNAILTDDEYRDFNNLAAKSESTFSGQTDKDIVNLFENYLTSIIKATKLDEIIRLEEYINLIKIELSRRNREDLIEGLNIAYNLELNILYDSELKKAQPPAAQGSSSAAQGSSFNSSDVSNLTYRMGPITLARSPPPKHCKHCAYKNPPGSKECKVCSEELSGGRRKTRRKAKLNRAKSYKRAYGKKRR